ncbi:hypothetical protein [Tunturiibacter gelidiferens]|uniref:hypothetical protein n=1 Tax=Tunturiibacter gelidiferens TaxID=3069689 RepID=UPI003D9BEBD3
MMKRGILRAGLWASAVVVLFVGAAGVLALCMLHKFNPDPPSNDFPNPANALEMQQQDIEQFSRLLAMDRALSPAARIEANRQIIELKAERVPLDRGRFHVALLRITALADNGHTNLYYGKGGPQNFIPCVWCCLLTDFMSCGQNRRMRIFWARASKASKTGRHAT